MLNLTTLKLNSFDHQKTTKNEMASHIEGDVGNSYFWQWICIQSMDYSQNSILRVIQHINKYKWNSHCTIEDIPTTIKRSKRDTDVKNSLLDSVGEGEGGMIWEGSIETCILSYGKWIAVTGLMHETRVLRAGALGWP